MPNTSSIEDVKLSNRQAIVDLLRGQRQLSRTQLARESGLSKATVTRILNEMIREGLIEETRAPENTVGRPHILLRLAPRTRCAVGVELTANVARITLTDMNARPLKQRIQPVYNRDVPLVLDELAGAIKELCNDVPVEQLVGVGIAVPGIVNAQTGVVNIEFPGGWHEVPLAALLSERLGLPVIVARQAHAAAWGEKWYEAGSQISDLLYVRLGTVVDAGVILGGRLHTGKMLTAGAIGHMVLDPQGELCTCNNHGCLNTIASTPALLAHTRARLKENSASMLMAMVEGKPSFLTMDHLMQAVQAGDALAVEMFKQVGRGVGVIVAGLFNLLNLERVVIGGQLSMAGNALLLPLQEEVYRRALPSALVLGRVEMTRLGADGASIGAASLVLQDPTYAYNQR